jgi:5-azacytidine-induced protein 1
MLLHRQRSRACCAQPRRRPQASEARYGAAIAALKEGWAGELRRQREGWAAAERARRDAWAEGKAAEIKALTVKVGAGRGWGGVGGSWLRVVMWPGWW